MPKLSANFIPLSSPQKRRDNDFQVDQQSPLCNILRIQSSKPFRVTHIYSVDLSQPCDAGQYAEYTMRLALFGQFRLHRQAWPWPNKAKVSTKYVQNLWQLINLSFA